MDRQTKLDVLQNELSRKDLSFGCIIKSKDNRFHSRGEEYLIIRKTEECLDLSEEGYDVIKYIIPSDHNYHFSMYDLEYLEILGHPVILSDVLVWLDKNRIEVDIDGKGLLEIYSSFDNAFDRDLTKPYLSEQDDTVIDGLYEVFLLTKKD